MPTIYKLFLGAACPPQNNQNKFNVSSPPSPPPPLSSIAIAHARLSARTRQHSRRLTDLACNIGHYQPARCARKIERSQSASFSLDCVCGRGKPGAGVLPEPRGTYLPGLDLIPHRLPLPPLRAFPHAREPPQLLSLGFCQKPPMESLQFSQQKHLSPQRLAGVAGSRGIRIPCEAGSAKGVLIISTGCVALHNCKSRLIMGG